MWIGGGLSVVVDVILLFFAWARDDEREAARIDRRLERASRRAEGLEGDDR